MNLLPALLIGGPPHSGKSVLAYSLSQALRTRNVPHYLMRAAPDGEGNWAHEIPPRYLSDIRFKGQWSSRWTQVVCRDIAARTLPLLVDVGGRPTDEQLEIFDQCTAAILITRDADARAEWRHMVQARGLPILADLHSALDGEDGLTAAGAGAITGTLAGLHRGDGVLAKGPAFDAVAERVAALFTLADDRVRRAHLAAAPPDATLVDFGALALRLYLGDPAHRFLEPDIEAILAAVPPDEPIAAYGVIPSWLAASLGARRELAWQFDARQGWLRTPRFIMCEAGDASFRDNGWFDLRPWERTDGVIQLDVKKPEYYLDYAAMHGLRVPHLPGSARVTFFGPLPLWVFAALGRAYRGCAGVWAEQPQRIGG